MPCKEEEDEVNREQNRRSQWLKAFQRKIAIVLYLPLSSSIFLTYLTNNEPRTRKTENGEQEEHHPT